jgi:glycosyltransferase involved in cell wall biosynthesis
MKILLYSTLYPNSAQPGHAPFVEQRLLQLINSGGIEARVVAPVPWFPFWHPVFGQYALFAKVASFEERSGVSVDHPKYPVIPKVGMSLAPFLMALWSLPRLLKIRRQGYEFDVIDAHFVYPDGIAAVILGQWLNVPVVVTGRGSDIALHMRHAVPRWLTKKLLPSASALVTVCDALKQDLLKLGIRKPETLVLRNGVDLELFRPVDRERVRLELNLKGNVIVSVGRLAELKGHDLTIRAIKEMPDTALVLVGSGPEEQKLKSLVAELSLGDRVHFVGNQPQEKLAYYYSMADVMVLASSREGWANVLLESMACGTPVVATDVGGTREVIGDSDAGLLVRVRTSSAIASRVQQLLSNLPRRSAVRRYAEGLSWESTSEGQKKLFLSVAAVKASKTLSE